jgi:hypothetical protein
MTVKNFFIIKPTDALIFQIYSCMKLYMFQAVPLPIPDRQRNCLKHVEFHAGVNLGY